MPQGWMSLSNSRSALQASRHQTTPRVQTSTSSLCFCFEELTGTHLCPAAEPGLAAPPRTPRAPSSGKQECWKEERRRVRTKPRHAAQGTAAAVTTAGDKTLGDHATNKTEVYDCW